MNEPVFLTLSDINVDYGRTRVLDGIDLSIAKGEFVALLGASGCGKTTLLRTLAGFVQPRAGKIAVAGKDVTHKAPDKRGMALVFQSYALWPHMSVAQNIGYGLKLQRLPAEEIARRVSDMESLLGLQGFSKRKPANLSGGQRQRVALGRALAVNPEILLLDEPLSNLDARIRLTVRHEIRALQKRLGITAVHVTHDREEAMVMADRIVILDGGRIVQQGAPEEIYNRPVSSFVAAFMGAENSISLRGSAAGDSYFVESGPANSAGSLGLDDRTLRSNSVQARFRAEAAELIAKATAPQLPENTLELLGTVEAVSYPGGSWRHAVRIGDSEILVDAPQAHEPGAAVRVRIPGSATFLFDAAQESDPAPSPSFRPAAPKAGLEMSGA